MKESVNIKSGAYHYKVIVPLYKDVLSIGNQAIGGLTIQTLQRTRTRIRPNIRHP
jgi:hypothetical protein